jgi:hypothetical protein
MGSNAYFGFFRYICWGLFCDLGGYLFHYQKKYSKTQSDTEAKTANRRRSVKAGAAFVAV